MRPNPRWLRPSHPRMRRSPGCCWIALMTTTPRCCSRTSGGAGASRFPDVTAAAVYPVPDPVTGDQVMAALEFSGGEFDPGVFGSFLGEQPDLGTKWAPRLVRLTRNLPMTATHKISKPVLRRTLWNGEDPVDERTGGRYLLMTADRKNALQAEYARHGRDHLLRL